jgi:hypothetical protein
MKIGNKRSFFFSKFFLPILLQPEDEKKRVFIFQNEPET